MQERKNERYPFVGIMNWQFGVCYVLTCLLALVCALVIRRRQRPNWDQDWTSPKVLTREQLSGFNGRDGSRSYLTVLGEIFDVSGSSHYSKDSGYSVFLGRDATRAFVTGDFDAESASDDVSTFDSGQMKGIEEWVDFYRYALLVC